MSEDCSEVQAPREARIHRCQMVLLWVNWMVYLLRPEPYEWELVLSGLEQRLGRERKVLGLVLVAAPMGVRGPVVV